MNGTCRRYWRDITRISTWSRFDGMKFIRVCSDGWITISILYVILRCCHSDETTPAGQLHWLICLVGFIVKRFYLLICLFIYLFVVSIAREREKGAGFMKNPGIITFKLHGFFPERLYLRRPSLFIADLGLFRLCEARSVPGLLHSLALRELICSWGEFDKTITSLIYKCNYCF